MTEDEAKTKWCPFARVMTLSGNSAGTMGADTDKKTFVPLGQCIGSGCMVWQWEQKYEMSDQCDKPDGEGWRRTIGKDGVSGWWDRFVNSNQGNCGMTGRQSPA